MNCSNSLIEYLNGTRRLGAQSLSQLSFKHIVCLAALLYVSFSQAAFPEKPIHIGAAYKGKYSGDGFIGQVLSISMIDLKRINGFPNMFWGWGGEDDAMRNRMKKKIDVLRPDTNSGFRVLEHKDTRLLPDAKNMRKWEDVREDAGRHGLNDVKWKVVQDIKITPNIRKITVEIK
jgi:hypothetical protein